jgi:hypothetical protein
VRARAHWIWGFIAFQLVGRGGGLGINEHSRTMRHLGRGVWGVGRPENVVSGGSRGSLDNWGVTIAGEGA